jgi:hypothetical protein
MNCGVPNCKRNAVWLHTYYKDLSVCGEHFKKTAAYTLRSLPSKKRSETSRENGKLGGRPRKIETN